MPISNTTFSAIRNQVVTVVEALSPTLDVQVKFRRAPRYQGIRDWASENPTDACYRKFAVRRIGESRDPEIFDPSAFQREQDAEIVIAYPLSFGLYGASDVDSMEDHIASDAAQIRDAILSPGNLVSGWNGALNIRVSEPERGSGPWFQTITFTAIYYHAQTLT